MEVKRMWSGNRCSRYNQETDGKKCQVTSGLQEIQKIALVGPAHMLRRALSREPTIHHLIDDTSLGP